MWEKFRDNRGTMKFWFSKEKWPDEAETIYGLVKLGIDLKGSFLEIECKDYSRIFELTETEVLECGCVRLDNKSNSLNNMLDSYYLGANLCESPHNGLEELYTIIHVPGKSRVRLVEPQDESLVITESRNKLMRVLDRLANTTDLALYAKKLKHDSHLRQVKMKELDKSITDLQKSIKSLDENTVVTFNGKVIK